MGNKQSKASVKSSVKMTWSDGTQKHHILYQEDCITIAPGGQYLYAFGE